MLAGCVLSWILTSRKVLTARHTFGIGRAAAWAELASDPEPVHGKDTPPPHQVGQAHQSRPPRSPAVRFPVHQWALDALLLLRQWEHRFTQLQDTWAVSQTLLHLSWLLVSEHAELLRVLFLTSKLVILLKPPVGSAQLVGCSRTVQSQQRHCSCNS